MGFQYFNGSSHEKKLLQFRKRHLPFAMPSIPHRVLGRLFPKSKFGPDLFSYGNFITFKDAGFAAASGPPELMTRHYYELRAIQRVLAGARSRGKAMERSLEIGCGFGRLSPYLADHFQAHSALDINQDALTKARKSYPLVEFVEASATRLPFADRVFDCVITWTVLQHIPPAFIDQAMSELRRVLKPSGFAMLCEATVNAGKPVTAKQHTFDRHCDFYERGLAPLYLLQSGFIEELEMLGGSPGCVMVFDHR